MKKTALTIAGSDCSGGAGVQADIKTMEANGVYAMSVISVLTAQNTLGVQKLFPVSAECITAQIDSVFADIFPDAVKIGMPGTTELIQIIAERLRHYQAKHIVVDPVMLSSSGSTLVDEKAAEMMKKELWIQYTDKQSYLQDEQNLFRMLAKSEGEDQVVIFCKAERAVKRLPKNANIQVEPGILSRLTNYLGESSVKVIEKPIESVH